VRPAPPPRPTVCVGAIVLDDAGRLLVVQRGRAPAVGRWTVPGGRVENGERAEQAVVREVVEETGLHVDVTGFVGFVEVMDDEHHAVILDFAATVTGGSLVAGDDAVAVAWVTRPELEARPTTPGLFDFLDGHGINLR
jgi:8-oxo-dGTP diphosphatase